MGGDDHEGALEETGLEGRGEIGPGHVEEIAPGRSELGGQRVLGGWKGQLDGVRRHPYLLSPRLAPRGERLGSKCGPLPYRKEKEN